jgi:hypothetical protein
MRIQEVVAPSEVFRGFGRLRALALQRRALLSDSRLQIVVQRLIHIFTYSTDVLSLAGLVRITL